MPDRRLNARDIFTAGANVVASRTKQTPVEVLREIARSPIRERDARIERDGDLRAWRITNTQ